MDRSCLQSSAKYSAITSERQGCQNETVDTTAKKNEEKVRF